MISRKIFYAINIALIILGIGFIISGLCVFTMFSSRNYLYNYLRSEPIDERIANKIDDYLGGVIEQYDRRLGYLLFFFGLGLLFFACIGIFGLSLRVHCLILSYELIAFAFGYIFFLSAFTLIYKKNLIYSYIKKDLMQYFIKNAKLNNEHMDQYSGKTQVWEELQFRLECCGVLCYKDYLYIEDEVFNTFNYRVSKTCCRKTMDKECWLNPTEKNSWINYPCAPKVWELAQQPVNIVVGITIFLAVIAIAIGIYTEILVRRNLRF